MLGAECGVRDYSADVSLTLKKALEERLLASSTAFSSSAAMTVFYVALARIVIVFTATSVASAKSSVSAATSETVTVAPSAAVT